MANAFRPGFTEMKSMIPFIKKLKIPCVVTGVGIQMPFDPDFTASYVFDDLVTEFCKAVLDKSATIGVRGELTAKYLEKLGFKNHIHIIGCPSMYMNGPELKMRTDLNDLSWQSKVSFNSQRDCGKELWSFFERSFRCFKEFYYISQDTYDLRLIYAGDGTKKVLPINYPMDCNHYLVQENRMRFFVSTWRWREFCSAMDFSISMKIHGAIISTLAGTPTFLLAHDARTRELAEWFNIPYMNTENMDERTTPYSIYNTTDFYKIEKSYKRRFDNFVDFLNENNLDNIYVHGEESCFDQMIREIDYYPAVESILAVDCEEQTRRLNGYFEYMNNRIAKLSKTVKRV